MNVERIERALVITDQRLDCVPGISSLSNAVDIIFKLGLTLRSCVTKKKLTSYYFKHLEQKSYKECLLLIFVPLIGNIIIALKRQKALDELASQRAIPRTAPPPGATAVRGNAGLFEPPLLKELNAIEKDLLLLLKEKEKGLSPNRQVGKVARALLEEYLEVLLYGKKEAETFKKEKAEGTLNTERLLAYSKELTMHKELFSRLIGHLQAYEQGIPKSSATDGAAEMHDLDGLIQSILVLILQQIPEFGASIDEDLRREALDKIFDKLNDLLIKHASSLSALCHSCLRLLIQNINNPIDAKAYVEKARRDLSARAKAGDVLAKILLGTALTRKGTQEEKKEGYGLLVEEAEKGNEIAQVNLGIFYIGEPHPEIGDHLQEGIKLLSDAAARKNPEATFILGMYYLGIGGQDPFMVIRKAPIDKEQATKYLKVLFDLQSAVVRQLHTDLSQLNHSLRSNEEALALVQEILTPASKTADKEEPLQKEFKEALEGYQWGESGAPKELKDMRNIFHTHKIQGKHEAGFCSAYLSYVGLIEKKDPSKALILWDKACREYLSADSKQQVTSGILKFIEKTLQEEIKKDTVLKVEGKEKTITLETVLKDIQECMAKDRKEEPATTASAAPAAGLLIAAT